MSQARSRFVKFLEFQQIRLGVSQGVLASYLDISPRKLWGWMHGDGPLPSKCEEVGSRMILSGIPVADETGDDSRFYDDLARLCPEWVPKG